MRRKLQILTALLLSLLLLAGCSLPRPFREEENDLSGSVVSPLDSLGRRLREQLIGAFSADDEHNPDGLMFSQMRYERPDLDALNAAVGQVYDALDTGSPLAELEQRLDESLELRTQFSTMLVLADIYNCKDLTDSYYAAEYEWISAAEADVAQLFDDLYYACAASPLGAALEEDYFWPGFCEDYADPEDSCYNDESVALMQRESELVSRYRALMADPTIRFEGREQSYNELMSEFSGPITSITAYVRYRMILKTYYSTYSEQAAELFAELARVRSDMALAMGFSSLEEMEYVYSYGRDYTGEDAAVFLDEVRRTIVPIYEQMEERGQYYSFSSAPMSEENLFWSLKSVSDRLGGDFAEAFAFMSRYGLYDIEQSPRKAAMSFECYLDAYEAPFIFLDAMGTTEDLISFVHEFGHYTDAYVNFDASEPLDLAEVFSQGLEFLSLSYLDGVLSPDEVETMRTAKLYDALLTFVQQCAFAEFEQRVYALSPEELSVETLNALALEVAKDYGMYDESTEDIVQYFWMDITHFYEVPFYVISYPVSQAVAMQFYEMELTESGSGLAKYLEVLPCDYDGFLDTAVNGGLTSPFAKGALDGTARLFAEAFGCTAFADAA